MTAPAASLFTLAQAGDVEVLIPAPASTGGWGAEVLRGPAVTGLLARATERHAHRETRSQSTGDSPAQATAASAPAAAIEFRPVRATFDLFRPPRAVPSTTRARTVRVSRRMMLVDSELVQGETVVARSQTLLLRAEATGEPGDASWQSLREFDAPAPASRRSRERLFRFGGSDWTTDNTVPSGTVDAMQVWLPRQDIVDGEEITPFQAASSAADVTNLAAHWTSEGLGYINADATLTLTRLPEDVEIGIAAVQRVAGNGIAIGEGVAFDQHGSFGLTTVCGLAQGGNRTASPG
jgi:hypothetical protein